MMTNEQINAYTLRISQANASALTVITLELEITWIEEALAFLEREETEEFVRCIDKAQKAQQELMGVVNLKNTVALDVLTIFSYINKQLIVSKIKRADIELHRLIEMLNKLKNSFSVLAEQDASSPIMENSEKVYAGLTYGKGTLNENTFGGKDFSV